jgi:hypothetical protein
VLHIRQLSSVGVRGQAYMKAGNILTGKLREEDELVGEGHWGETRGEGEMEEEGGRLTEEVEENAEGRGGYKEDEEEWGRDSGAGVGGEGRDVACRRTRKTPLEGELKNFLTHKL